jgi:hypothetical protein
MIDSIGSAGTDFDKSGSVDSVKYTYRSHYAPGKAMVYLGYFGISYQPDSSIPRLAVVLDTTQHPAKFDFAAAVRVELDWLNNPALGALVMPCMARKRAQDSLHAVGAGNAQYWTKQHRVLQYNSWFTGDSLGGVWRIGGVYGGCGLDAAFLLPPDTLHSNSRGPSYVIDYTNGSMLTEFAVTNLANNTVVPVWAVKEPASWYYYTSMQRPSTFRDKVVKGYFDRDSILYLGANADVFIITGIVGERTSVVKAASAPAAGRERRGLVKEMVTGKVNSGSAYDLQGRVIHDGFRGMRVIIRRIGDVKKSENEKNFF